MTGRPIAAALALVLLMLPGARAPAMTAMPAMPDGDQGGSETVSIGYSTYTPARLDVVAGDKVMWMNDSARRHTVTPDAGGWDSGTLLAGAAYTRRFPEPGTYTYFCRLHAGMAGAVDVHSLMLSTPGEPAGPRRAYPLRGRAGLAPGTAVDIEADAGSGFAKLAEAIVADDGTFTASVVPGASAYYRAVAGGAVSPPVRLLVLDHRVGMAIVPGAHRTVVLVHVTPADPGGTVMLQLRLRDRFGWWPLQAHRLDHDSRTRFVVPRRIVLARAVLTLPDGATVLARSSARLLANPPHARQ